LVWVCGCTAGIFGCYSSKPATPQSTHTPSHHSRTHGQPFLVSTIQKYHPWSGYEMWQHGMRSSSRDCDESITIERTAGFAHCPGRQDLQHDQTRPYLKPQVNTAVNDGMHVALALYHCFWRECENETIRCTISTMTSFTQLTGSTAGPYSPQEHTNCLAIFGSASGNRGWRQCMGGCKSVIMLHACQAPVGYCLALYSLLVQ